MADPARGPDPTAVREVERKFMVPAGFALPDLDGAAPAPPRVTRLTATYYDTADLRLARDGVTLRRRTGGDDAGWHLKLPVLGGPAGARDELALPLSAGRPAAPPRQLRELVTAFAREAPLVPVATLVTERRTVPLRDPGGRPLAEVVDDTVSVVDGDHEAARFREVEVEDRGGGPAVLDAVARQLLAAGAVGGEFLAKAARALGPAATAPPDVPAPDPVRPGDPAREAVRAHLRAQVRALQQQDPRVRRDLPDAVHQMRVAARRLRSTLKAFRPLLDAGPVDRLRAELAWLAGELGAARDREVLLARLQRDLDRLAAAAPDDPGPPAAARVVRRELAADLASGRDQALAALRSPRYVALLGALVAACADPPTGPAAAQPAARALPPLVAAEWRRLARRVADLDPEGPDEPWHEARIAAKRARYAAEACVPVFGAPARRLARRLSQVTELLGEHQDAAVASQAVTELAATPRLGGRAGFALGLLHGAQRAAAARARADLLARWPEVSRRRWRRWLDGG